MRVGVGVEGHPRLLPDRAENSEPQFAPHAKRRLDSADAQRDFLGQCRSLRLATEHPSQSQDRFDRTRHRARIRREHRDTRRAHSLDVLAPVLFSVSDHQLGLELHDRGDVGILGAADFWNRRDRRDRLDAEFRNADDFGIEAQCEQRLRPARHQRHDSRRRARELDAKAHVVGDLHRACHLTVHHLVLRLMIAFR